jgi:hypothetical protein
MAVAVVWAVVASVRRPSSGGVTAGERREAP